MWDNFPMIFNYLGWFIAVMVVVVIINIVVLVFAGPSLCAQVSILRCLFSGLCDSIYPEG